jgi:hypothetical protein
MQYLDEIIKSTDEFKQELPEASAAQSAFNETVYKDSILSTR